MNRTSCLSLLVCLCAGLAVAQEPQPTVAPFPLELRRMPSGFSNKERDELQAEFRRLVRTSGAMVPNAGSMDSALLALKRQDCDRENDCLQQLAQKAQTLYGLYASADYDLAKNVIVTGRVVRDDGKLMGELKTITLPKGKESFVSVARIALVQLLSELKVKELPPFRESPSAEPVKIVPDPFPPPPFPKVIEPPVKDNTGARTAGYILAGVGGAAAVTGGVLLGIGKGTTGLNESGLLVDGAAYRNSQTAQGAGVVLLSAGAAVAVAGVVLVILNPKQTVVITPAVGSNAGGVVVGGTF